MKLEMRMGIRSCKETLIDNTQNLTACNYCVKFN